MGRQMKLWSFISLLLISGSILSANPSESLEFSAKYQEEDLVGLRRAESVPEEILNGANDPYFEGYIQALVDMHYYEYQVVVYIEEHVVYVSNLPHNDLLSNSIIGFIRDVPGVCDVKVLNCLPKKKMVEREEYVNRPRVCGVWFPQTTAIFLPQLANPRQVINSIGYRGGDRVMGKTAAAVSLGDEFPMFRWLDIWRWHGDLQISIESGIWSVFDMNPPKPRGNTATWLMNTDFFVAIPLTYAINQWAYRLRVYHESSHLGDEFMAQNRDFERLNPSFEAIDFFFSYQPREYFRIYGGPGLILHSDPTYRMKTGYVEYGAEGRFGGHRYPYHKLYGNFFYGAHFRNWQVLDWNFDQTYVLGYEWSKLQGVGRVIRFFGEFHTGYSLEGQFFKDKTTYGSLRMAYGF